MCEESAQASAPAPRMVMVPAEALEQALSQHSNKPCPCCGEVVRWEKSATRIDTVGNPTWEGKIHHASWCRVVELRRALAASLPAPAPVEALREGADAEQGAQGATSYRVELIRPVADPETLGDAAQPEGEP